MIGRDLHYMQTGTDVSLPPSAAQVRAAELIHRLREARPRLRLVRGETDRIEVAPEGDEGGMQPRSERAAGSAPSPMAETFAERNEQATVERAGSMPVTPKPQGISSANDPRWVLAHRTAESLQGTILGPERRERLVKLGKLMGLTAFDANLVIAIVQDQARRGHAPNQCAAAGEAQLAMVPPAKWADPKVDARTRRIGIICGVISVLVGVELIVLKWFFS